MMEMFSPNGHLVSGRIESPQRAFLGACDGARLHGLSDGTWDLSEALGALLDLTGPSDVVLSSWSFKGSNLKGALGLARDQRLRSLHALFDLNFCKGQPKLVAAWQERFGADCVTEWKAHSKFLALSRGAFECLYLTSANLHRDRRLEYYTLTCDQAAVQDYLALVADLLKIRPLSAAFPVTGRPVNWRPSPPPLFNGTRSRTV